MKLSALVTGGAGFIGSHLVRRLLQEGYNVRVIDNLATGFVKNLDEVKDDIVFIEGDIRDGDQVLAATEGMDCIFHQAAMASVPRSIAEPAMTHEVNVMGTLNILEAAKIKQVPRVVMASSSSVYGDTPTLPKDESMPPSPLSPYATHKFANELYAYQYFLHYGIETICLRYFNIFGPRQDPNGAYAAVIPCFVKNIRNGVPPRINGDGQHSRDFTFVANAVEGNLLASKADGVGGEVFNIATGHRVTIQELAEEIAESFDWRGGIEHGPAREGDILHSYADISKAEKKLGYQPMVSFEDGLSVTVDWFRELEF
ncbi:MAG: SDR family oxidoreductase [Candidatus Omnitrophica bacterium]|nr:SDR family oxidoreductase [Candidatus Omnitrophota bacterium]